MLHALFSPGTFADVPNDSTKPTTAREQQEEETPPDSSRIPTDVPPEPTTAGITGTNPPFGQRAAATPGVDRSGPIQGPHGYIHTIVSAQRYEVGGLPIA